MQKSKKIPMAKQAMAKQPGKQAPSAAPTHVALLRGINVGGKNILPMVELARICTGAGCAGVQTYIHSGNVVFAGDAACAKSMPAIVEEKILKRFGFRPTIVIRTSKEMAQIVVANPFVPNAADTKALYVGFLRDQPSADKIAGLDPNRSPGDLFQVLGRQIYMNLAGHGAADTKLTTAYFDSKLDTVSTFRNWRTVLKLHEMLNGES
ncbi:DUF1697 domain-containing protein [soil metagenome]